MLLGVVSIFVGIVVAAYFGFVAKERQQHNLLSIPEPRELDVVGPYRVDEMAEWEVSELEKWYALDSGVEKR